MDEILKLPSKYTSGLARALLGYGSDLPPKISKLYLDFGVLPKQENGHELALKIAEKYIKEFKVIKKRGPKENKWNDMFSIQFHMLVWIKKIKNKSSVRQAILHAAKEIGDRDYLKNLNSYNTRYYEIIKNNVAVIRQEKTFKHFESTDPKFLPTLEAVYKERYTALQK